MVPVQVSIFSLALLLASAPPPCGVPRLQAEPGPRPLALPSARDATRDGLARVELAVTRRTVLLQEAVRVRVRFGLERRFLESALVQPFARRLDVPVQLLVPWADGLPGAVAITTATGAAATLEGATPAPPVVALNDGLRTARAVEDVVESGRKFATWELELGLVPTSVGALELAAPVLVFAHAARFEESLFDPRVPIDRVDAFASGTPLTLDVVPWPEAGRPPEFTGAVGRFAVSARALPRDADDAGLAVELRVEGEGNLETFPTPHWREVGGLRVLGALEERAPGARVFRLDLAPPEQRVGRLPGIPFDYLDPGPPPTYRVARTEPIALPADAFAARAPAEPPAEVPVQTGWRVRRPWSVAVGLVLIALGGWLVLRRRR
jgi:LPXTG-motif cell wall-anchored protein